VQQKAELAEGEKAADVGAQKEATCKDRQGKLDGIP